jgi:hypothetical protein
VLDVGTADRHGRILRTFLAVGRVYRRRSSGIYAFARR